MPIMTLLMTMLMTLLMWEDWKISEPNSSFLTAQISKQFRENHIQDKGKLNSGSEEITSFITSMFRRRWRNRRRDGWMSRNRAARDRDCSFSLISNFRGSAMQVVHLTSNKQQSYYQHHHEISYKIGSQTFFDSRSHANFRFSKGSPCQILVSRLCEIAAVQIF